MTNRGVQPCPGAAVDLGSPLGSKPMILAVSRNTAVGLRAYSPAAF